MGRLGTIALSILAALVLLFILRLVLLSSSSKPPATLGVTDGRLAPCPATPNCVASRAPEERQLVEPIVVAGSLDEAMAAALAAVESMDRSRVVTVDGGYLHAELTSRLFRFVDDLELLWDEEQGAFEVRSASRVGHSDLGVNRRRVETLRALLARDR